MDVALSALLKMAVLVVVDLRLLKMYALKFVEMVDIWE
jgi:hypothetical protein